MSDLKAQLEIAADASGVEAGVSKAKRSLADLGVTGAAAGKQVGAALSAAGDGGTEAAAKVGAASRSIVDSMAKVGAAGGKTGSPLAPAGAGADEAAKKVERASASIKASIERVTASQLAGSKTSSEFYTFLAKQRGVDPATLKPYLDALDAANAKTKSVGISAGQTAAALRSVPAQFTDIATSLAGGQSPLQVLFQQGGQLKDMFGGIGPAARALGGYIGGLINPLTVAGAAAGVLALAYSQGADESIAFSKSLILTGNAAGTTAGRLADSARNVAGIVGTVGKAAEVLDQLAAAPNINPRGFEQYAAAAIRMERATGVATAETVKNLADLGESPLAAALKLNKGVNFLTASVYQQIKALQDSGREADAAAVAQTAYAEALSSRAGEIESQLGILSKGWRSIKDAAGEAWDAMLNIGRAETLGDRIAAAQKRVDDLAQHLAKGGRKGWFGERVDDGSAEQLDAARAELASLQVSSAAVDTAAKAQADAAALIKARAAFDDAGKQYVTGLKKLNQDIEQARNIGKAAGATPQEISVRVADIRFKFDLAQYEADAGLKIAIGKAAADAEVRQQEVAQRRLEAQRNIGAVSERAAAEASLAIETARLASQRTLIERQIELERRRPLPRDDSAAATAQKAKLAGLRADLAAVKDLQAQAGADTSIKLAGFDITAARESAAEYARLIGQADDLTQQHARSITQGLVQLITDPLARARAEADMSAQGIEAATRRIADSLRTQIDVMRGRGDTGQADILQQRLAQIQATGAGAAAQERAKPGQDVINKFISRDIGTDLSAGFDSASQSLGTFVQTFGKLLTLQEDFNRARSVEGATAEQIARIDEVHMAAQLNGYGSLAGAAKGFFKQHTAGYKLMEATERGFRAVELGLAINNAVRKLSLIQGGAAATVAAQGIEAAAVVAGQTTQTGAVIAGEAERNAAKVPGVFMAFMSSLGPWGIAAAAAAIALVGVSASGGIRTGSVTPLNSGTGTVLGDPTATSASITKSLDALTDVNTLTMRYSAQMLDSLRSIDAAINGVSALLVQGGGITASLAGVQIGSSQNALGKGITNSLNFADGKDLVSKLPVIGNALAGLIGRGNARLGNLFGSSTSVLAQGISGDPQQLGKILADGFAARFFSDVQTKDKVLGLTTSVETSTQSQPADAETSRQFSLILAGLAGAVSAAAGPLGIALDEVKGKLDGFVVDIGRISLLGLTGQEISDKLSAVFSAAGDKIARAAVPGLEKWQAVGEGYLETLVRVATNVDVVMGTLEGLGQSTAALSGTLADRVTVVMGLIDSFGSRDKMLQLTASYLDSYYTAAEKSALTTKQLASAFGGLGLSLPKTKDQFRQIVEAQDLSTEAGRKTYASLLSLADVFATLTDATSEAGQTIIDEIKRLRGITDGGSAGQSAAQLQGRFAVATAQARAGDQAALESLPEISKALEAAAAATATSALDGARLRAWLAGSLSETLRTIGVTVPGFAAGGTFAGGWRVVGEQGAELEATGAARIFDASQTRDILSGGDNSALLAEMQALRTEVAGLRGDQAVGNATIARHVRRSADFLDRVIDGGDALRTTT